MSQMKYKFNNWNTTGRATDLAVSRHALREKYANFKEKPFQNHFTRESFLKMLYYL